MLVEGRGSSQEDISVACYCYKAVMEEAAGSESVDTVKDARTSRVGSRIRENTSMMDGGG